MDDKVIISIPKISELSLFWVGKHGYYTLARIIKSPIGGLMVWADFLNMILIILKYFKDGAKQWESIFLKIDPYKRFR